MTFDVPFRVLPALLCVIAGYLLGNIQTAIIVSKAYYHDDVRNHGSGNAGSTNMVRVYGMKPGAVTFVGDFLKAVAGVLAGRLLMGTLGGYIAGYCVVVGHCYPVFDGFRGGKGVASSCGLAFMVFPLGAAITLPIGVAIALITKKISYMSLLSVVILFLCALVFQPGNVPLQILLGLVILIVYIRHAENIKRILHGEEKPLKPKSGENTEKP